MEGDTPTHSSSSGSLADLTSNPQDGMPNEAKADLNDIAHSLIKKFQISNLDMLYFDEPIISYNAHL